MTANEQSQTALPRPRRHWLASFLLAIVIFAAGLLAGVAGTSVAIHRITLSRLHNPQLMPERLAKHMKRRLRLNDQQAAEVQKIFEKHQQSLSGLYAQVRPQMDADMDQLKKEIDEVLTPAQAAKWDKRFDYMRDKWTPPIFRVPGEEPAQTPENK